VDVRSIALDGTNSGYLETFVQLEAEFERVKTALVAESHKQSEFL
jgi:hypothetical protein